MIKDLGLSILETPDGYFSGAWGPFTLKSAFQPIFRMDEGRARIAAFEGLARPFKGGAPSSPGKFFPLVPKDQALNVESLTRSVHMLNASKVLAKNEWLFINFDPSMFEERANVSEAMHMINTILNGTGMRKDQIVCEVTEHRLDERKLVKLVEAMRGEGFKVAVDDYGAENSDMDRIKKLKPDIVKFDAYLITRWMNTSEGTELLKMMVATFKEWGILTLFEGLEETWQLDLAAECKVDFVQGFVLAKPAIVPTDFTAFRNAAKEPDVRPNMAKQAPLQADQPMIHNPKPVPLKPEPIMEKVAEVPNFDRKKTATFGKRGL